MRYIIIGDIHGCASELVELIELIKPSEQDVVIPIGDLVHKGPDEAKVIDLIQSLTDRFVLGNHEEKQLRWEKHEANRLSHGKTNPMKNVENFQRLSEEHLKFLKDGGHLFVQLSVGDSKYLLIHGGIEPRMRSLPSTDIPSHLPKKELYRAMNMIRTRYVNPEGKMVPLGAETSDDKYWADIYDGRFGKAIFGHQPFDQSTPKIFPHAVGIDLGCVYGGYLCAYIIDGNTGEESFVTVHAKAVYALNQYQNSSEGLPNLKAVESEALEALNNFRPYSRGDVLVERVRTPGAHTYRVFKAGKIKLSTPWKMAAISSFLFYYFKD